MCGILGEYSPSNSLPSIERFKKILDISKSRGPDESSIKSISGKVRFGFNRLSILDLSKEASQPIWSPSGRYLIVFNGEIYNHIELRKNLGVIGENIKSHGDTVSLAYFIDKWGINQSIESLEGMFAIGIWDREARSLSLARDFAGIKPLFYGYNRKGFVFSSQYNQISSHPFFIDEEINQSVLKLYISQHYIPPPFGLLKNTYSVFPGEIVKLDKYGKLEKKRYWSFPKFDNSMIDYNDARDIIENEIMNSVKEQLISDVPLGAFLSGGVDSPLICNYAKNYITGDFNTFSIGSDSAIHDETHQSSKYARALNSKHHIEKMTSENSFSYIDDILRKAGEPFGDSSILPTWKLSHTASSKVTVILSGDGADELFFGYERFQSIAKNHWLWNYPFYVRYFLRGLDRLIFDDKFINECVLSSSPGDSHFGLHSMQTKDFYNKLVPGLRNIPFPESFELYKYSNPKTKNELLHMIRKVEFYGMLQKTLTKVDRAAMANSIEVRVPFLKKKLIEKIVKTGIETHSPMKERKKILYDLLIKSFRNIKPEFNKKGLSIPLKYWIIKNYRNTFCEKLLDEKFCHFFGIEINKMEEIINDHINEKNDYKWPLFTLYSLAVWNDDKG